MRKPKTGRTADQPAEHPPASLIWTVGRLIILARYLFAFIEVAFGSKVAKRVWREAARRPRQRSIKALSDADMAVVLRFLAEREKAPQATPNTLARRVAKAMEPEDAGPDRLRNATKAVRRVFDRYEKLENGHRAAVAVPDPLTVVLNIDRVPKWPF